GSSPPAAPFAALHDANPDNLVDCLRDEHPQAIALILAHLPAARCAEVLSALSSQQQFEVVKRLAHIEQASAEVIREVEHSLEGRVRSIVNRVTRSEAEQNRGAMADVLDRAARGSLDTQQLSRSLPSPPQGCGPLQVMFEDL